MGIKAIAFSAILVTSIGSAQTLAVQNSERVFSFTTKPDVQSLQEAVAMLRAVGDIRDLSLDAASSTITVHGTAVQLGLADWLITSLDVPAGPQTTASAGAPEYRMPGDSVVKVFYLSKPTAPQHFQEVLAVLRAIVDVQNVFSYSAQIAIVVRCAAEKMTLAENLFDDLDRRYWVKPVVKVFYLSNPATPQDVLEAAAVMRAVVGVQRAFGTAQNAIVVRCDADRMALVEKLFSDLDRPAAAK
jgi:type II secretory pathway component GspD/PulD (secretin)